MTTKRSLKDKVQQKENKQKVGISKSAVAGVLFGLGSIFISPGEATSQSNDSNNSAFRLNLGGGGKYENATGFSGYLTASPQINLNKKGDNAVWLGPYFNYNFGNNNKDVNPQESSTSETVNQYSGTEKHQDKLYEKTVKTSKPYGFGLNLSFALGEEEMSELELKAGLTKKNTSMNEFEEKTIIRSRNGEKLSEDYISEEKSSSSSKHISDFSVGFNKYFGDKKNLYLGGFIGTSDYFYGGIKLGWDF